MTDISTITDKELMDEIYKRKIPFIANIKLIFPKIGSKDTITIESIKEGSSVNLYGCLFDNTKNPVCEKFNPRHNFSIKL